MKLDLEGKHANGAAALLAALLVVSLTACDSAEPEPGREVAPCVRLLVKISDSAIVESSGVVASRRFPGVLWTHNIWKDYGYVVSKVFGDSRAQIFRFPLAGTNTPLTLELVATTKIESPVTGADISADGRLLALVAKNGAYVYRIDGDVAGVTKAKPYYARLKDEHVEGCCFVADGLLATSENRDIFLFTDPAFRGQ